MEYVIGALENEDIGGPLVLHADKILFSRKESSDELDKVSF